MRTAWTQPVASVVTIVIVAGMCVTVLLTTGRTVGAEQSVLRSIDSAGTRSIVVRAEPGAGLRPDVLDRLKHIDGIEWAGAFGPAEDYVNSSIPDGTKVPVRYAWGGQFAAFGVSSNASFDGRFGWGTKRALEQFGMLENLGGAVAATGADIAVSSGLRIPEYLEFLEPLVIVPVTYDPSADLTVSVLVVTAETPGLVAPVAAAVQSVLALDDPTAAKVSTSESLAQLRAIVQGQLGDFSRGLVVVVFVITSILVAAILYSFVMLRRRDFGRRRALGASQGLIACLLLIQVALLAGIGAGAGLTTALAILFFASDPLPGADFVVAVGVLSVTVGLISALIPAIVAARRDPLRELRVP
jgi:putative ABC transport system permease protein